MPDTDRRVTSRARGFRNATRAQVFRVPKHFPGGQSGQLRHDVREFTSGRTCALSCHFVKRAVLYSLLYTPDTCPAPRPWLPKAQCSAVHVRLLPKGTTRYSRPCIHRYGAAGEAGARRLMPVGCGGRSPAHRGVQKSSLVKASNMAAPGS